MAAPVFSNTQFEQLGSFHEVQRKDYFDATASFCGEKYFTVLKACYTIPEWFMHLGFLPQDNSGLNNFRRGTKLGKLSRWPIEMYKSCYNTVEHFSCYLQGKKHKTKEREISLKEVAREALGCVNPFWEMADFFTKTIFFVPTSSVQTLNGINGGSLIASMLWNLYDSIVWIKSCGYSTAIGDAKNKIATELCGHVLKIARDLSFLAIGILTFLSVFFQFVFAPLVWSSFSVSTIFFTILDYYHEQVGKEK